jgi:Zn-finger nucleic acid-binding protein
MRLVACATCATQYDASGFEADGFDCRCGERVDAKPLTGHDAQIARCGSCGASVSAHDESCGYCTSSIARSDQSLSLICPGCYARNEERARFCTACGLRFDPEAIPVEGIELPCPCCGALMQVRSLAGVAVNECAGCNGLWAPEDRFDSLVSRAIEARQAHPERASGFDPRTRGANPVHQDVTYRRCPACEQFMARRNYRKSSGVIIDQCRDHGTWLDADELEAIAGFILSGGRPAAEAFIEQSERQAEADYQQARHANLALEFGASSRLGRDSSTSAHAALGSFLGGLLSSLFD